MQRGFTLIELVMILTLLAILAAVAIPRFSGYGAIKQGNAVLKIASDIRYAQNRATTTQKRSKVSFTGPTIYDIYSCATASQCPCASWTLFSSVDLNSDYPGVTISSSVADLEFNSLGRPDGAGTCTALAADATVTVYYTGEANIPIYIRQQTGMVSY